ncbi:beta-galactosidase [Compostimonas suwonensis]|uniref:Beta-galactosidase n=2 Tax=Compostimonas suwonensis TaxID=1048394 RepID=A0A2M9BCW9_9MICO|nr:beta-galactosidase [Compostimonas suwonensis]
MDTSRIRWPQNVVDRFGGEPLAYGGDYNPEQWDEEVWADDVRLMREAGVNLVTVGVFSWSMLQPAPDRWEFGWLDRILDLLHENEIAVDLATATASPPPWLTTLHPEVLPVDREGHTISIGGRQAWSPSSPVYREYSLRLVEQLANRYAQHPALALWHVSNELGGHNSRCYSDVSAAAFREWLRERYGTIEALNAAWLTAVWSQRYGDWSEILPPRLAWTEPNPAQQLDFDRFSSAQLQAQLRAEVGVLRRITPEVPITTNFILFDVAKNMDYTAWSSEIDIVSNDHYLSLGADPQIELAWSADRTRGMSPGRPWMLMETSPSAVSWRPVNTAKTRGQLRRNALAHVARGSDTVCFFQWRAARGGAERFHSAMLPHAGSGSRLFHEVTALGADLRALGELAGSTVTADCALIFSEEAWWASELDSHPHNGLSYPETSLAWYRALWKQHLTVDVVSPLADLSGYTLIVVPLLHLVTDEAVERLRRAAENGAQVVITYFSGIVDEHDQVRLGGYPGAFRELLGLHVEEFAPLMDGDSVDVAGPGWASTATRWHEEVFLDDAEAVASYSSGEFAGEPAVTRVGRGEGGAWYVSAGLDDAGVCAVVRAAADAAGVEPEIEAPEGVEAVVRRSGSAEYAFLINHTAADAVVGYEGTDLLDGSVHEHAVTVPAAGVRVIRRAS